MDSCTIEMLSWFELIGIVVTAISVTFCVLIGVECIYKLAWSRKKNRKK